MRRRVLLLLLLLTAVAAAALRLLTREQAHTHGVTQGATPPYPPQPPNRLRLEPTARELEIPLSEMVELDFKTRAEVHALRAASVQRHPELLDGRYAPSTAVFGQIEDGRPWWGIFGTYYAGPGPRAIDGPSEETRFIVNPFLLAGVIESHAWTWKVPPERPVLFHPRPLRLVWHEGGARRVRVVYDVGRFFRGLTDYRFTTRAWDLTLVAYNARDLGFTQLRIDPSRSRHVRTRQPAPPAILPLTQFIHRGPSCGYPGGCNNMSPHVPQLELRVEQLPAQLWLELWIAPAGDPPRAADLSYLIEMS